MSGAVVGGKLKVVERRYARLEYHNYFSMRTVAVAMREKYGTRQKEVTKYLRTIREQKTTKDDRRRIREVMRAFGKTQSSRNAGLMYRYTHDESLRCHWIDVSP